MAKMFREKALGIWQGGTPRKAGSRVSPRKTPGSRSSPRKSPRKSPKNVVDLTSP
jgi:hypothetical protein